MSHSSNHLREIPWGLCLCETHQDSEYDASLFRDSTSRSVSPDATLGKLDEQQSCSDLKYENQGSSDHLPVYALCQAVGEILQIAYLYED